MHMHACSHMCRYKHPQTRAHTHTRDPQALTERRSPQRQVQDEDSAVHYILLSAPWAVLCYYAEDLRLKLPLQVPGMHGVQRRPGVPQARVAPDCTPCAGCSVQCGQPEGSPLTSRAPLATTTLCSREPYWADRAGGVAPPTMKGREGGVDSECSSHLGHCRGVSPSLGDTGWGAAGDPRSDSL